MKYSTKYKPSGFIEFEAHRNTFISTISDEQKAIIEDFLMNINPTIVSPPFKILDFGFYNENTGKTIAFAQPINPEEPIMVTYLLESDDVDNT